MCIHNWVTTRLPNILILVVRVGKQMFSLGFLISREIGPQRETGKLRDDSRDPGKSREFPFPLFLSQMTALKAVLFEYS